MFRTFPFLQSDMVFGIIIPFLPTFPVIKDLFLSCPGAVTCRGQYSFSRLSRSKFQESDTFSRPKAPPAEGMQHGPITIVQMAD